MYAWSTVVSFEKVFPHKYIMIFGHSHPVLLLFSLLWWKTWHKTTQGNKGVFFCFLFFLAQSLKGQGTAHGVWGDKGAGSSWLHCVHHDEAWRTRLMLLVHMRSCPLLVQGLSPRNGAAPSQASLSLLSYTSLETPAWTHPEVWPTSFQLQSNQQWRWVMMNPPLANLVLKHITCF